MISDENMSSAKPYLIRALHQWIIDNSMTPLVVVQSAHPKLQIPSHLIQQESVVFNISWDATDHLQIADDIISFQARFSGKSYAIELPVQAITAIYSRENGKGMMFEAGTGADSESGTGEEVNVETSASQTPSKNSKDKTRNSAPTRSHLKLLD